MPLEHRALIVLLGALALDLLSGEPPESVHPVVWIGRTIDGLKRYWSGRGKFRGLALVFIVVTLSGGSAYLAYFLVSHLWPPAGLLIAIYLFKSTFSLRALLETSKNIAAEIETEPDSARLRLRALVGRDTSRSTKAQMRSAVIESLFENLVDSLVTPSLFYLTGLQLGVGFGLSLALFYKAANTLDSMIGYRTEELEQIGFAAAKLDDLLNFLPARLTAGVIGLAGLSPRGLACAVEDSSRPSSPNSGWPMSAAAGVLGVQLVKPGHYVLGREYELPQAEDLERALGLAKRSAALIVVLLAMLILLF